LQTDLTFGTDKRRKGMRNSTIIESFLKEVEIRLEVKCKKFLPSSEMTYHAISQAHEMIRREHILDVMTDVLDEMKVREEREREAYNYVLRRSAFVDYVPPPPPPPPTTDGTILIREGETGKQ
jgi:hypothetical protein